MPSSWPRKSLGVITNMEAEMKLKIVACVSDSASNIFSMRQKAQSVRPSVVTCLCEDLKEENLTIPAKCYLTPFVKHT